jgi:hypothetical protein
VAVWNDDPEKKKPKDPNAPKSNPIVGLAHELIHCLHFMRAECGRRIRLGEDLMKDTAIAEEEARTVGLGPFKVDPPEPLTENGIRKALGLALRTEYAPGNALDHVRMSY